MYRCQDCLKEFEVPMREQLILSEFTGESGDIDICPNCGSDFIIEELGEQR